MIRDNLDIHSATNRQAPVVDISPDPVPLARMVVAGWWIDVTQEGELIIHCDRVAVASIEDDRVVIRRERDGKNPA